jgi:hypothetical protein
VRPDDRQCLSCGRDAKRPRADGGPGAQITNSDSVRQHRWPRGLPIISADPDRDLVAHGDLGRDHHRVFMRLNNIRQVAPQPSLIGWRYTPRMTSTAVGPLVRAWLAGAAGQQERVDAGRGGRVHRHPRCASPPLRGLQPASRPSYKPPHRPGRRSPCRRSMKRFSVLSSRTGSIISSMGPSSVPSMTPRNPLPWRAIDTAVWRQDYSDGLGQNLAVPNKAASSLEVTTAQRSVW